MHEDLPFPFGINFTKMLHLLFKAMLCTHVDDMSVPLFEFEMYCLNKRGHTNIQ